MAKKKILIVEDNKDYRNYLNLTLERLAKRNNEDISLDSASSLEAGIEYLTNNSYEIVFTDGCLITNHGHDTGDWSGVEIAKEANSKGMYVVGISSEPEKFQEIAKENLSLNYKKPFSPKELEYILLNKPTQKDFDTYRTERRYK